MTQLVIVSMRETWSLYNAVLQLFFYWACISQLFFNARDPLILKVIVSQTRGVWLKIPATSSNYVLSQTALWVVCMQTLQYMMCPSEGWQRHFAWHSYSVLCKVHITYLAFQLKHKLSVTPTRSLAAASLIATRTLAVSDSSNSEWIVTLNLIYTWLPMPHQI